MIAISVLSSLLVFSLCATGACFLKWGEAKQTIAQLQIENNDLKNRISHMESKNVQSQEIIASLQAQNDERKAAGQSLCGSVFPDHGVSL